MTWAALKPERIEAVINVIVFDARGLVPVVTQRYDSGEVLMLAWMNAAAVRETLSTGSACYWSRSRQSLWRKGETSGHVQHVVDFRLDCDKDAVLLLVDQVGPACHTNRPNCFFNAVREGALSVISEPVED